MLEMLGLAFELLPRACGLLVKERKLPGLRSFPVSRDLRLFGTF
jgi:hypothetical protein